MNQRSIESCDQPGASGSTNNTGSSNSNTGFASAFAALKDSSLYEAAQDVPLIDPKETRPLQPATKVHSQNSIIVSSRQRGNPLLKHIRNVPYEYGEIRGNPLLKHIRNVPYEYGEIVPDYVMGATTCAVFLSLRYHRLNPQYIHERLKLLGQQYVLRVLLLQIDVSDPHKELQQLSRVSVLADLTLMLSWSAEEAARVLEVYKIFEHKPPDLIMERQHTTTTQRLLDALTTIHRVSRPDAMTLLANFGSLEGLVNASVHQISSCPGLGPQKAEKIYAALHQPFCKASPLPKGGV